MISVASERNIEVVEEIKNTLLCQAELKVLATAGSDKYVAIYEFEQMPQQGRSVDVHAFAETLRQIFYIKVMMLFSKI